MTDQRPELTVEDMFAALPWYAAPDIPEDAPHEVKEGCARRRHAALVGLCPCGAATHMPLWTGGVPGPLVHSPDCPGDFEQLAAAADRWLAGDR